MRKFDLEAAAQIAVREGSPFLVLDESMSLDSNSAKMVPLHIPPDICVSVEKIANQNWEELCVEGLFNGRVCAVQSLWTSGESVAIEIVETDYKSFLATDLIIEGIEGYFPPLSIGVHALLLGRQSILALKLAGGALGTPGGALDIIDFEGEGGPFVNALLREIREETGIQVDQGVLKFCGTYIVHKPLHLAFVYVAFLRDDLITSADFDRAVEEEKILGIQSIGISEIPSLPNSIHDALGLCISAANRLTFV